MADIFSAAYGAHRLAVPASRNVALILEGSYTGTICIHTKGSY